MRGQAEAIHTAPRFVAKDPAGATVSTPAPGAKAPSSATTARSQHIVEFVREQLGEHAARGHRPPRRARRAPVRPTGARRRRRCSNDLAQFVPLAPLHQPHNLTPIRLLLERRPELPQVACFDTAFHRAQPELAQMFALPSGAARRRRAALRLPRPVVRVHRIGPAAARPERGERPLRGPAPGQRRQHVRAGRRPQRRQHDGLHRGRRAADGHALRRPRSRASSCT